MKGKIMSQWIPSRKYLAGGLAGIAAFFIATLTGMDAALATQVAGGLWALVSYLIPPGTAEIIDRYNDHIRRLGE
jgi:hypothetical protein